MSRVTTAISEEEPQAVETTPDLVARAKRGDPGAFDELYLEHVDRVYALCLRMSADTVRARDLTQDVFVRVWRTMGGFRGESRFSTWLHRVAANVVLESMRSELRGMRRLEVELPDPEADVPGATLPSPTGATLDLERALARLPAGARAMLVLHAVEGYQYQEIAEMSGVALGTVKAQIHRARRLLREILE